MIAAVIASIESTQISSGTVFEAQSSTDGRYVITSNKNHHLILWDFKHHVAKLISNSTSDYSAHFVKGSHDIEWRDNITYQRHVKHIS